MPWTDSRNDSDSPDPLREPYWRPWLHLLGLYLECFGITLVTASAVLLLFAWLVR